MRPFPSALAIVAALLLCAPASAQVPQLESPSRGVREVDRLNRSMLRQGQDTEIRQQNQFELNQMRQQLQRLETFPPVTGPGVNPRCPPGSVGC